SDALTTGDLALLSEWGRAGGVVVLGYDADGEGYLDRWTANRWLEFEGAGIAIGDRLLEDTTVRPPPPTTTGRPQPWAEARAVGDEPLGSVYDPFPLDRNHVITVRHRSQLVAVPGPPPSVRPPRPPGPSTFSRRSPVGPAARRNGHTCRRQRTACRSRSRRRPRPWRSPPHPSCRRGAPRRSGCR